VAHGKRTTRERALSGNLGGGCVAREATSDAPTDAAALLILAFIALSLDQQERVYAELTELRLQRIVGNDGETARRRDY
jgi:hypothetical protein